MLALPGLIFWGNRRAARWAILCAARASRSVPVVRAILISSAVKRRRSAAISSFDTPYIAGPTPGACGHVIFLSYAGTKSGPTLAPPGRSSALPLLFGAGIGATRTFRPASAAAFNRAALNAFGERPRSLAIVSS